MWLCVCVDPCVCVSVSVCVCVCCKVAKTQRASLREIVELSRKRNSRPSSDRAKFSCCHFANICLVVWQRAKHFYNSNKKHQSSVQSSRVGFPHPLPFPFVCPWPAPNLPHCNRSASTRIAFAVSHLQCFYQLSLRLLPFLPLSPFSSLPFPSLPFLVPLLLLLLRLLPVFFDPCIDIFFACVKNFANFITVIWYAPFGHAHTLTQTRTHTDWHTQTHIHANAGQISKQHGQVQVITVNFVCVKVLLFLPIPCKLHHRWGSMH